MKLPFWPRRREEELNEEIQSHLRMATRDKIERGVASKKAKESADREFGNTALIQDVTHDQWGWRWLEDLSQDVRYALRMLRKSPGFAVVAILTLAIGIGANTAIFSVISALLLDLPYPHPERLVVIDMTQGQEEDGVSLPDLQDWQQRNKVFEGVDVFFAAMGTLTGAGAPKVLHAVGSTSQDFRILGVAPELGRTFLPEEDGPEGAHVAILSDALWRKNFSTDRQILGKSIRLDDSLYTVVGVMPAAFKYPAEDLWIPLHSGSEARAMLPFSPNRQARFFTAIARLKPGETLKHAQQQMDTLVRIISHEHPAENEGFNVHLTPLRQKMVGLDLEKTLMLLFGAVGFVLLIACANVANLSLARISSRRKELAIRFALGGSRGRLLRQLLTESTLISLLGGGAALLFAIWITNFLLRFSNTVENQLPETVSLDGRVFFFTVLISVATGAIFGLLPALRASKTNPHDAVKETGRSATASVRDRRLQGFFVVVEIALSLILLLGAGLLMESFARILRVNLGFDPSHVLAMEIYPPLFRYPIDKIEKRAELLNEVVRRIKENPEVQSVAVGDPPMAGDPSSYPFEVEGRPARSIRERPQALLYMTTPGYFHVMRIPLLEGRDFTSNDRLGSPRVAIINRSFAQRYFGNEHPVGKRLNISYSDQPDWIVVVGVVGDVKSRGLDMETQPTFYWAFLQGPASAFSFVIETRGDPTNFKLAAEKALWSVDPDQPVMRIDTMNEIVKNKLAARTATMFLLAGFAAFALALAAIGIFGVMSYSVAQRTHEIGVRVALGARRKDVLRLVIGHGLRLALVGAVIGMAAALALTHLMSNMLFGVSDKDPITFAGVSILLVFVALVACYIPARRAMRVDPMMAIRYE